MPTADRPEPAATCPDLPCNCRIPELEGAGQHSPSCDVFKSLTPSDQPRPGANADGNEGRVIDGRFLKSCHDTPQVVKDALAESVAAHADQSWPDPLAGDSVRELCHDYWQAANSPKEPKRMDRVVAELEHRIAATADRPGVPADVEKAATELLTFWFRGHDHHDRCRCSACDTKTVARYVVSLAADRGKA